MATKKQNLEFQLTWCKGNLLYLLGDPTPNEELIAFNRGEIERIKNELEKIKNELEKTPI